MSKQQQKQRVDKLSEIVDFRFLQFNASKVPNGWDKLVVSVISLETGKAIARTNKAVVRGGSCKWLEDVSESVRFLQDDNSRELEEKLYKFVVSMGSARLGILGEATVNLADYLNSKDFVWIQLPLKKCNHGTILQVKIQCLTPRSGARESELWSKTVMEPVEQISVFDEEDNESESSIRRSSFRSRSNNTQQEMESKTKDVDLFSGTSHNSLNLLEELSGTDSAVNGNSKGFVTGDRVSYTSIKNGLLRKQRSRSFGVKDEYPQNRSFDRANPGSQGNIQGGIENIKKGAYVGGLASGNGSSSEFLEAAEMTIKELRKESILWERKAQNSILEIETLKQQLGEQKQEHREMEMQFLTVQTERDSFKQEVEQLKSTMQGYIESKKGAENARFEAQDARHMVKEYEDELELLKESNVNLSLQLRQLQNANEELVSALQELEETVEEQNVEIEKILEGREKIRDVDISVQENEEMRDYKELRVKFSNVVAERDTLKKDIEQLRSYLEQRKYIGMVKAHVEDSVVEFQDNMKTTYSIGESQHDLHQYLETLKRDMDVLERDCNELTDENLELICKLNKLNKHLELRNLYITELEEKLRVSSFDSTLLGEGYIGERILAVTECGGLNAQVNDADMSSKTLCSTALEVMEMSFCNSQSQAMGIQNHSSCMKIKLNTLKERINELESNLENTHGKSAEKKQLAAFSQHQLDAHIPLVSQAEEDVAPIKNVQTLELLNSNETFFIKGLKVLVTQLSEKIELSECLGNAELADIRSLNDFQDQFKELQSQKLAMEGMLNVFKNSFQDLEREVIKTQQEMIEREIELIVTYECRLEDNDLTLTNTEKAGAYALQLVQTLEDEKSRLSLEIDGLQDHINDLEQKLTGSKESYRADIGNYTNLISDFQDQARELQDQKHVLQGQINVLKERIHELECEVQTAEKKKVKREEEVTADYKYKIQKTEARVIKAEADLVDCLERLECFQSSRAKDESRLIETEEKNFHLFEQVHSLEMQLHTITEEWDSLRLELENTKASFNHQAETKTLELKLKEENCKLQKALHESERKLSGTLEELDFCKVEQKLLEITLENLRKEHTAAIELQHIKEKTESRLKETEEKTVHLLEQVHSLEMQLNNISEERDSLRLDLQNTSANCFNHEAKMIAIELELKEENGKLQQVIYESQKMLSGTLDELDSCKKERQLLEITLENLRREHATAVELQHIIEETECRLKETEEKNVHLFEQLDGLEMQLKDIGKERDSFKVDLENTNGSYFTLQAHNKALELELQQSEAELLYAKQELKLEVEKSREKEEDLHFKLELVHRQLEDTKFREVGFLKRVQEMETKVVDIENEKQKVEAENINISSHVDELMGLMVETDVLQIIVKDVSEEKTTLQQSLHSTEADLRKLREENVSLMGMLTAIKEQIPEVEELKKKIAELEEKIFCLETEEEMEQKIKSMQFQIICNQFELKLQGLEEDRDNYRTKLSSLQNEQQLKVNTLSEAEYIIPGSLDCVVGCTFTQLTGQVTILTDRIRELESELDTRVKEFEEKEEMLITEIQKLEDMNQHLMQAKLDSETDQLQNELIRLQNQNSALSQNQQELQSKLVAQELFQKEVYRLQEVNKQLESQLIRIKETVKGGNILERVVTLESELANALEANSMYMLQLRSFLQQEHNVHAAALHSFGSLDQVTNDLVNYKRRISTLEVELNDMRERYSSLSLKLAEVEVEREELVMTIKHAKYGKRWRGKN